PLDCDGSLECERRPVGTQHSYDCGVLRGPEPRIGTDAGLFAARNRASVRMRGVLDDGEARICMNAELPPPPAVSRSRGQPLPWTGAATLRGAAPRRPAGRPVIASGRRPPRTPLAACLLSLLEPPPRPFDRLAGPVHVRPGFRCDIRWLVRGWSTSTFIRPPQVTFTSICGIWLK